MLTGLLMRGIDYSDSLLADRYTHFVSIRVMNQAAALDLTTYEDPVFYDRLERARVQATDRLAMIQQMGRLFQQTLTTLIWTSDPALVLPLAGASAGPRRAPYFPGRNPFCLPGICEELPPDSGQTADGLPAPGSRQPGRRQRAQALQFERRTCTNRFTQLSQGIYEENVALSRKKLIAGGLLGVIATLGYYGAYAFVIWRAVTGSYDSIGEFYYLTQCHHSGFQQSAAGVFYRFGHSRPGPVPHRSAGLLRDEADGDVESQRGVDTAPDPRVALSFATSVLLIRAPRGGC